ncbi:MAG: hypothetical protein II338_07720 [Bacteroidaceae bacterium]|jgi:hypothetical protein|nr:hypothetical protein [Bacteroidaceae bacterium]MBQ5835346.1 hypothetical protein [Bacteroidaceae bacterium]MBQ5880707.1 hypothetical protein [Bacteroidaceae bacterium]MBQ5909454.1 hypothetical protein [Bacteroidaceae bacterium]
MKKCLTLLLLFVATLSANAQFEQGTKFVGASLSGLNLSYSGNEKFRFGLDAEAGYFVADCVMLKAYVGYEHTKAIDDVRVGAQARYYFRQNGIYLGAGAEYNHFTPKNNDIMIPVEVGYAFYINHYLTIEPAVYYKMSLHDFGGNSTVGARIGIGYYF